MSSPGPLARGERDVRAASPDAIDLRLTVRDPEVVAALAAVDEGPARDDLALNALRIGILALGQAQGRVDTVAVRTEGERLVAEIATALDAHRKDVADNVATHLKDYFHPESGRFHDRVQRLVKKDGELEQLLRQQVGMQDSELARTLAAHLGESSPLMRTLDPTTSGGVVATLGKAVETQLTTQRERVLQEFSLDRPESALSRLVRELGDRHGKLETALAKQIDVVVAEFSLDTEDSALSRLVKKVDAAQKQISSEFSLDNEQSALARLRGEMLKLLADQGEASRKFQGEVTEALAAMKARRAEAAKSTRHGLEFEDALGDWLAVAARRTGDVLENCSNSTGLIRGSKIGDFVLTLSADSHAAGASVVFEAKKDAGYDLKRALGEMDTARKNRGATAGVFAWSRACAPEGTPALARYGDDVVVVWDAEDPGTDAYLEAALSLARALCTRAVTQRESQAADLAAMEKSVRAIETQARLLGDVETSATTIQSGATKILERMRISREALTKEIANLDEALRDLKAAGG